MKELSIKEKAYDGNYKVYTELINRLENVKNAIKKQNYGIAMDILYKPYPEYQITTSIELKECEDLRITKAIKYGLDHVFTNNTTVFEVTKEQCLSWLEKQGEHSNFLSKIQVGDKVTRNEDGVLVNLSQLNRVAKKQGEQKPIISNNALREGITHFGITQYQIDNWLKKYVDVEKQGEQKQELLTKEKALKNSPFVEQKPAEWSEDDQSNFCELRSFIVETYRAEDASKLITWLKSLKDRVQPQPKQEWSDKDEKMIHHIENAIKYDKSRTYLNSKGIEIIDVCNWLKSLMSRKQWKPSEEQVTCLQDAISDYHRRGYKAETLETLLKQLKQL